MAAALSLGQARRIALAAQGLNKARSEAPASSRAAGRVFDRLHLVQIDSVNVLSRSHYLPFFSRLGDYDRDALDRLGHRSPRKMIEYWAHEASYIRPELFPALRSWQRRSWVGASGMDPHLREEIGAKIVEVLQRSRPLTAVQLTQRLGHVEERPKDGWGWNWNSVKRVVEDLFERGIVSSADRTRQFERRYALTSKVLPAGVPAAAGMDRVEAMILLTRAAAQAHGIGTIRCFADYFRMPVQATAEAVAELLSCGELEEVVVDGWDARLYKWAEAPVPRRAAGRALLSPFDSMVFERTRLERLFDFRYRLEIYTPAEKRVFGYYVLPFLLRDQMAARVVI